MYGLNVKVFLKNAALRHFNIHKKIKGAASFKQQDFGIYSVRPAFGFSHGYEIYSRRLDDSLRIQLHFNITKADNLSPFELQLTPPTYDGALGDEVWVTQGTIDNAYFDHQGYVLPWLEFEASDSPVILQANNEPLLLVDGGYLILS